VLRRNGRTGSLTRALGDGTSVTSWKQFDAADYIKGEKDIALYLDAVMEEAADNPALLAHALGDVARARRNMSQLARDAGVTREGLYKALSPQGNPSFATVARIAKALGLEIHFRPLKTSARSRVTVFAKKERRARVRKRGRGRVDPGLRRDDERDPNAFGAGRCGVFLRRLRSPGAFRGRHLRAVFPHCSLPLRLRRPWPRLLRE